MAIIRIILQFLCAFVLVIALFPNLCFCELSSTDDDNERRLKNVVNDTSIDIWINIVNKEFTENFLWYSKIGLIVFLSLVLVCIVCCVVICYLCYRADRQEQLRQSRGGGEAENGAASRFRAMKQAPMTRPAMAAPTTTSWKASSRKQTPMAPSTTSWKASSRKQTPMTPSTTSWKASSRKRTTLTKARLMKLAYETVECDCLVGIKAGEHQKELPSTDATKGGGHQKEMPSTDATKGGGHQKEMPSAPQQGTTPSHEEDKK